jgi:hypothetical protein
MDSDPRVFVSFVFPTVTGVNSATTAPLAEPRAQCFRDPAFFLFLLSFDLSATVTGVNSAPTAPLAEP